MTDDTACLVDATPSAMAEGINNILDDEAKRQRLADNAIVYIEKEHSLKSFKQRLEAIYSYLR